MRIACLLLVALVSAQPCEAVGAIIPADRLTTWQGNVGVPGGIPNRTVIGKNAVTNSGADPTGVVDATTAIQNTINGTPSGQVAYIPAGTYKIAGQILISSNVTLRGAGTGLTILAFSGGGRFYTNGEWPVVAPILDVTSGATAGSSVLTVPDASTVVVGKLVTITQTNPSWVHFLSVNYGVGPGADGHDNTRLMAITAKVISKTSTTVTIEHPLPINMPNSPKLTLWNQYLVSGFGFEDMTCDMLNSRATAPINLVQIYGCWITNVEFKNAFSRQCMWSEAVNCEIRHCYSHDSVGTGPNHEGVDLSENACFNLIEDNIFVKAGKPALILGDWGGGCVGNVIGYNYFEGDPAATGALQASISVNHGPHNMFNLIEGNIGQSIQADGYYGGVSHTTVFRNCFSGDYPSGVDWRYGVQLAKWSYYFNFVGNVLGKPDTGQLYTNTTSGYSTTVKLIWQLGYPNTGNTGFTGTYTGAPDAPGNADPTTKFDQAVVTSLIRHGNYDYFNKSIAWDSGISDHTIPKSLYLGGRPSWWPVGVPWPCIGSDLSPLVSANPAQARYLPSTANLPAPPTNLHIQ